MVQDNDATHQPIPQQREIHLHKRVAMLCNSDDEQHIIMNERMVRMLE